MTFLTGKRPSDEDYPIYCQNATVPGAKAGWAPSQLECDGEHAEEFYSALLTFALYWNATLVREQMMEVELPSHGGIDLASFAKHSVVREMITRRDVYHPRYGVPPQACTTPAIKFGPKQFVDMTGIFHTFLARDFSSDWERGWGRRSSLLRRVPRRTCVWARDVSGLGPVRDGQGGL
jgi:hypothetical protein